MRNDPEVTIILYQVQALIGFICVSFEMLTYFFTGQSRTERQYMDGTYCSTSVDKFEM